MVTPTRATPAPKPNPSGPVAAPTLTLLQRARDGDEVALNRLVREHLPLLHAWAQGRLPRYARDLYDTDDLVQVTLVRALGRLKDFEPRDAGAFLAYLRRILLNQIRDQIRRARRRPSHGALDENLPDRRLTPLEATLAREGLERYEAEFKKLAQDQQEAILLRVHAGYTYEEIARSLGRSSPNAARLLVTRALARLEREANAAPTRPAARTKRR
jgi:RNA polymerase sigma factor (sigma-70 family)